MRRAWLITSVIPFVALFAAGSLQAQWQVTADAGVAHLQQSGLPESSAPTLGMNANTAGDRWDFASSALAARTSADRWTAQGVAAGTYHTDALAGRQWDLTGYLSSFSATNDRSTVATEAMAQARFGAASLGAAIGAGAGMYAHDGAASLVRAQADAWRSVGVDRFLGEASAVVTKNAVWTPATGTELRPLSYTDLSATWRREYSGLSFGATAGLRAGLQGAPSSDEWASADATVWFTSRAAIAASVGRTLDDAVRGLPRTQYVSVAIRIAAQPHARVALNANSEKTGVRVSVEPAVADHRRITIVGAAPNAASVELMADFTDWTPVALERSGNAWITDRALSPGLHRMALRIDGGAWTAPANLPHVTDDLGGVVGLITVP